MYQNPYNDREKISGNLKKLGQDGYIIVETDEEFEDIKKHLEIINTPYECEQIDSFWKIILVLR